MKELVFIKQDDVYTDSWIVAEKTENEHKSVKQLISDYKKQLEIFGVLSFSKRRNSKGTGRPETGYLLNEPQTTLLLTLMNNNEIVINFKVELIKQFYAMRRLLLEKQTADWQTARLQSKQIRLQETDAIKQLVEYAKNQGSEHADKLYMTYSKLVKQLAGYDKRDNATTDNLIKIMLFETTLFGIISEEIVIGTFYKEIYRKAKQELTRLKLYWSRPLLPQSQSQSAVGE